VLPRLEDDDKIMTKSGIKRIVLITLYG